MTDDGAEAGEAAKRQNIQNNASTGTKKSEVQKNPTQKKTNIKNLYLYQPVD